MWHWLQRAIGAKPRARPFAADYSLYESRIQSIKEKTGEEAERFATSEEQRVELMREMAGIWSQVGRRSTDREGGPH